MDKIPNISLLLNDKEYWKATVAAVEEDLPTNYVAEVKKRLQEQGHTGFTDDDIRNVKLGRKKTLRVVSLAIYEVGMKYQSETTEA